MRLIHRLSLLAPLASLLAAAASAQSPPPPAGTVQAMQQPSTESILCLEPSSPQAVAAAVELCVDRLVKANTQEIPGARLDVAALPENDLELLSTPDQNQFVSPPRPPGVTSWSPKAIAIQPLATTPAISESPGSSALQLPAVTILASTEVDDSASLDLVSASSLDRKLNRARVRAQQEARLRRARQAQKDLDQQCRQMHLSNLECRLKLKNQKQSPLGHTDQIAQSHRQTNR
jgi:hypothetical protein